LITDVREGVDKTLAGCGDVTRYGVEGVVIKEYSLSSLFLFALGDRAPNDDLDIMHEDFL